MIAITLAQMRRSLSRLVPAGLAIALGTAFVAATLVTGNVMTRSTYDGITAQYAHADLVVTAPSGAATPLTEADLATVLAATGVRSATGLRYAGLQLEHGSRQINQSVIPTSTDAALTPLTVTAGVAPTTDREIALPAEAAARLHVGVGQTVSASWWQYPDPTPVSTGAADLSTSVPYEDVTADLTVTGLVDDPSGAYSQWGGMGLATPAATSQWVGSDPTRLDAVLLTTSDVAATRAALERALPTGTLVRTKDESAAATMSQLSDGSNALVAVILGFAAIALLVAALVIANTFQVLVAQRTRTLALLRCVGARRSQLRTSVLLEGSLLGLGSSAIGLITGLGLAQLALVVLGRMHLSVPLPTVVPLSVAAIVVPLVVGTLVTVAATLVPARAATRVSPVAALRPQDAPAAGSGAGRFRLVSALLLTIGGGVLLAGATILSLVAGATDSGSGDRMLLLLAAGVLGGAASFVGVLVGAVFWMPRVIGALGRLIGRLGPASRLAAANTTRNPRRTAATSTALLIGVTLVMTMSTGAASARRSLDGLLNSHYPVDLVVDAGDDGSGLQALPAGTATRVSATHGIDRAVEVPAGHATAAGTAVVLYALTVDQARSVLRDHSLVDALTAGSALVPASLVPKDGSDIALSSASHPQAVSVTAAQASVGRDVVIVTPELLTELAPQARPNAVWARLSDGADAATVLADVQDSLTDRSVSVSSSAAERAGYERIIDTLLAIVLGLLGVAVLIALIGVTNTLSLSVLERRRESATLRAVGLTRRQLRGTLAVEGMTIAVVGAVLGIVLGMVYGWAGAEIVFGSQTQSKLAVPWTDIASTLVVALLAGLLASVLPARSAARTPPVAALATE